MIKLDLDLDLDLDLLGSESGVLRGFQNGITLDCRCSRSEVRVCGGWVGGPANFSVYSSPVLDFRFWILTGLSLDNILCFILDEYQKKD